MEKETEMELCFDCIYFKKATNKCQHYYGGRMGFKKGKFTCLSKDLFVYSKMLRV